MPALFFPSCKQEVHYSSLFFPPKIQTPFGDRNSLLAGTSTVAGQPLLLFSFPCPLSDLLGSISRGHENGLASCPNLCPESPAQVCLFRIQPLPVLRTNQNSLSSPSFCSHLEKDIIGPKVSDILNLVLPLVDQASEDILILIMETLLMALKVDPNQSAAAEAQVGPLVMSIWTKYATGSLFIFACFLSP